MIIPHPKAEEIQKIIPSYKEIELIGDGGFKTVYKALCEDGPEVVKVIALPPGDGQKKEIQQYRDECIKRAFREINVLGICDNYFIVKLGTLEQKLVQIGNIDYVIYSEEFLDGSDLSKLIEAKGELPGEGECRLLFKCLLLAIEHLWTKPQQFIHRDIKPHNVIKLDNEIRPFVLLDLGITFSLADTALTFNAHERLPPATFKYIAPEMANPNFRKNLDYRSDLYSSALTVFEYAAQVHPLARSGDDPFQSMSRAVREPPKPLKRFRNDFSSGFCILIDQLLKKKPSLRPANIRRLISLMESSS